MKLANLPAVVTGGASGIGRATARRMAEEGAAVAVIDINGDAAHEMTRNPGFRPPFAEDANQIGQHVDDFN